MEKTKKISVSDLSIGDWVRYDFPEIGKRNIQVNSIDEEDNHIGAGGIGASAWSDVSEFEPIPITAEILEKNGLQEAEFGLVVKPKSNELCASMGVSIEIKYIHELQHILRLMKTEKEIVL